VRRLADPLATTTTLAERARELHEAWLESGDPDPEAAAAAGRDRARRLLAAARLDARFWRELLGDLDPLRAPWDELPVLDRGSLAAAADQSFTDPAVGLALVDRHLLTRPGAPLLGRYQAFHSAGAGGVGLRMVYDQATWARYGACLLRVLARAGATPAGPTALLGSDDPAHTLPRLAPLFGAAGRVVGLQGGLDRALAALQEFQPLVLVGYSSALAMVARAQLSGRVSLRPRHVLAGTDALGDEDAAAVRAAWGVDARSYYSTTEAGVLGSECAAGRGLHLNLDTVNLDAVALDRAGPLVTNLANQVQPIVRYRLPDRLAPAGGARCPCGSPAPRLRLLRGRGRPVMRLAAASGGEREVHPIVFRSALDRLAPGARVGRERGRLVAAVPEPAVDAARRALETALEHAGVDLGRVRLVVTPAGGRVARAEGPG
jgi:phenylacetate-CoA ligase